LDYFPYGSTRISVATSTRERRQFIGQFTDDSSLSYLNARYYNGSQGQFLTEDPIFWGDPKQQTLLDPQSLNTYSYANDNPVARTDPKGLAAYTWNLFSANAEEGFVVNGYAGVSIQLSYVNDPQTDRAWITPSLSYAEGRGSINGAFCDRRQWRHITSPWMGLCAGRAYTR
jgi:RHS repeat-associated protein